MKREVFRDLVACQSEFAVLGLAPGLALRPRRAAYGLAGLGYRQGAALHAGRIQAPVQSVSIAGNVFCGAGSSLAVERGEALGRGAENSTVARLGASKGQQIFKGYIWLIFLFSLSVSGEACRRKRGAPATRSANWLIKRWRRQIGNRPITLLPLLDIRSPTLYSAYTPQPIKSTRTFLYAGHCTTLSADPYPPNIALPGNIYRSDSRERL
jgi:hypothetical protein